METFAQLLRHKRFAITETHDLAVREALNRLDMLVGDLAATDDGNA
jgi:hypothetical protein